MSGYLEALAPRRGAVLFQVRASDGPLCTWLVTTKGITSHVAKVEGQVLAMLMPGMRPATKREAEGP